MIRLAAGRVDPLGTSRHSIGPRSQERLPGRPFAALGSVCGESARRSSVYLESSQLALPREHHIKVDTHLRFRKLVSFSPPSNHQSSRSIKYVHLCDEELIRLKWS